MNELEKEKMKEEETKVMFEGLKHTLSLKNKVLRSRRRQFSEKILRRIGRKTELDADKSIEIVEKIIGFVFSKDDDYTNQRFEHVYGNLKDGSKEEINALTKYSEKLVKYISNINN